MRRILFLVLTIYFFLTLACKTTDDSIYYPALDGQLDPFQQVKLLSKTVNMGDFLECPPPEGSWQNGRTIEEYFLELIKKGFTAVRIPIRFSAYAAKSHSYSISKVFFERVD